MNFSLYDFRNDENLQAALEKIRESDWGYATQEQAEAPGRLVLTATKKDYVFTESTYKKDVLFFQRIADLYAAQYDGWFVFN